MDFDALQSRVVTLEKYKPMLEEMFTEYTAYKARHADAAKAEADEKEALHHEQWLADQAEQREKDEAHKAQLEADEAARNADQEEIDNEQRETDEAERVERERIEQEERERQRQKQRESDADFRTRILAGENISKKQRAAIEAASGEELDAIGETHGLSRQ